MGLRKCGHQVFNANCAACHAGGQNSVVADHTLEKAAIEKYLTGGFKESSVSTQVQSLPRLNLTSSRFRESACPPCSATVSSVSTHVTTAGVRQAADSSILRNEEIPLCWNKHALTLYSVLVRPLVSAQFDQQQHNSPHAWHTADTLPVLSASSTPLFTGP